MEEWLKSAIYIMVSYVGILFVAYAILAWMMSGLLYPYLKVKLSRGRLSLVKVKTITQDYFRPGKLDKGFIIFKDRQKDERRISIPTDKVAIYRSMGINMLDVDDEKNAVNCIDYTAAMGFDAVKYNFLYLRTLYGPNLSNNKEKIVLAVVLLILVAVLIEGILIYNMSEQITQLGTIAAPTIVGGGA